MRGLVATLTFLVGITACAFVGFFMLVYGVDAILDWESSSLRDDILFQQERAQEQAVVRAISDGRQAIDLPIQLVALIDRPMRRACLEGWGAPGHVWQIGEAATMRRKSYRSIRRSTGSDHGDAALAIEFRDGAILAMLVPFGRASTDFGTTDRFVCAEGGRMVFTWHHKGLVTIRGY